MKVLELAIKLRDIMSKGKSEGSKKAGSCGGDNDPRVLNALAKLDMLARCIQDRRNCNRSCYGGAQGGNRKV
jgi:hypothetical protein